MCIKMLTECQNDVSSSKDIPDMALEKYNKNNLKNNPLAVNLVIPVTKIISDTDYIISEGTTVNKTIYVQRQRKVTFYHGQDQIKNMAGLSDRAQRLLLYVFTHLERNVDYIQINVGNYMKLNGIKSVNTYKEALKELIRYQYLCKTEYRTVYWINPRVFYSGDRVKNYKDKLMEVTEWEQ